MTLLLPTVFSWEEGKRQLLISSCQRPVIGHKGELKAWSQSSDWIVSRKTLIKGWKKLYRKVVMTPSFSLFKYCFNNALRYLI